MLSDTQQQPVNDQIKLHQSKKLYQSHGIFIMKKISWDSRTDFQATYTSVIKTIRVH